MSDTIRNEIKVDKTALSYWYPKLVEAGIPVPKTKIVAMPPLAQKVVWNVFDGKQGDALDAARIDQPAAMRHFAERQRQVATELSGVRGKAKIRHRA